MCYRFISYRLHIFVVGWISPAPTKFPGEEFHIYNESYVIGVDVAQDLRDEDMGYMFSCMVRVYVSVLNFVCDRAGVSHPICIHLDCSINCPGWQYSLILEQLLLLNHF